MELRLIVIRLLGVSDEIRNQNPMIVIEISVAASHWMLQQRLLFGPHVRQSSALGLGDVELVVQVIDGQRNDGDGHQ